MELSTHTSAPTHRPVRERFSVPGRYYLEDVCVFGISLVLFEQARIPFMEVVLCKKGLEKEHTNYGHPLHTGAIRQD